MKTFFQLWRTKVQQENYVKQHLLEGRINVLMDLMQGIYLLHLQIVDGLKNLSAITNGANIESLFRLVDCSDDILNRFERDIKAIRDESIESEGVAIELTGILEDAYLDRIASMHLYADIVRRLQASNKRSLAEYE